MNSDYRDCRNDSRFVDAVRMYREGDIDTALILFRKSAESGNPVAQYTLGSILLNRGDVSAVKWIRTAAEQGYPEAQFQMGNIHYLGTVGKPSPETALQYYRMAAENGSPKAQNQLGLMYLNGEGTKKSDEEAFASYVNDLVVLFLKLIKFIKKECTYGIDISKKIRVFIREFVDNNVTCSACEGVAAEC